MPSATAAQWILKLVTTPERAAAITGDLLEVSSRRHPVWFWLSLLRTAAAHIGQDLCSAPVQMLWLCIWGILELLSLTTLFGLIWLLLWMKVVPSPSPWIFYPSSLIFATALPLFVCWDIARRSKSRELAAALAFLILVTLLATAQSLTAAPSPRTLHSAIYFFHLLSAFLAGALLHRRRHC